MNYRKLQLSFGRLTDSDLLTKANHILESMLPNPAFPDPIPTLAEVQVAVDLYSAKLMAALDLGRVQVSEKNQARVNLEQLLYRLGLWVSFMANGVDAILLSSGFTVSKDPAPRNLDKPGDVNLTYDITSGTLISSISKGNATSFLHEITDVLPTSATNWKSYPTSTRQFTFTQLIPGHQYWVRVAVVGSRKQLAYSNVATQFAAF